MITTKYKLFESEHINNPWSEIYRNKFPSLKELYNELEIEIYKGEEWVILHHFSSAQLYEPKLNHENILKQNIISKYDNDFDKIELDLNNVAHKSIDMNEIEKFLTYPKYELDSFHINILSKILGYSYFGEFVKHNNENKLSKAESYLDPSYFATASATRDDQSQLPFNVIMFYINLKDQEDIFSLNKNDYIKIRYPLKKLYPLYSDPFHYMEKHPQLEAIKAVMTESKKNGFNGDIKNWKTDKGEQVYRCDIWEKILLTYYENGEIKESEYLIEYELTHQLKIGGFPPLI